MEAPLIGKFLEYLALEKRFSMHTVLNYKKDLADFQHFLLAEHGHQDTAQVLQKDVRNFIIHQRKADKSPRTVNRKISCLRSFYKFLLKIGEVKLSPAAGIRQLPSQPKIVVPITEDEVKSIPGLLTDLESDFFAYQRLFLVELFYQTGMRRQELINLTWEQLSSSPASLRIMGKGNKERIVPLSGVLVQAFNLLRNHTDRPKSEGNHIFITKKGKPLYAKLVYSAVNSYLSNVSAKEKLSPHVLRHSFATHLLNKGAEVNSIKELLGHASLASTQVYLHNDIENLKKVFNQTHPRGATKNKKTV